MSLINDALKRARETQPTNPPEGAPPLPPVEPPARSGFDWLLPLAIILALLVVACIFMGAALLKKHQGEPVAPKMADTPAPTPPPAQPASPKPDPASIAVATPAAAPAPAAAAPIVTNAPPATNAAPPKLKLQGVVYAPKHPTAIVNGKSVSIGDSIGGFRVKTIMPDGIQLQHPDGSMQTLKVGE